MIFGWVTNYMVRSSLSPLLIPILQEFKLTYTRAGILATAFFFAYTFMQLPAGHLGDRLGRKVVLVLCTSWWGLMSLFTGLAYSFAFLFLFMAGFFIWGHWAAFYALLPDIVPYEILGTAYGLTHTIHFTGSLIAPWMTGWIKDVTASFSWGLCLAAIFCVLGGILIFSVRPAFRFGKERSIS
jgi:MFS family permease